MECCTSVGLLVVVVLVVEVVVGEKESGGVGGSPTPGISRSRSRHSCIGSGGSFREGREGESC